MSSTRPTTSIAQRSILLASLGAVTALAWLFLVLEHRGAVGGLADSHFGARGFAPFVLCVAVWIAMMVGMMLPSLVPWILRFAALSRPDRSPVVQTHLFVSGYVAVWSLFAVIAAAAQLGLGLGAEGAHLSDTMGARLGGAALLVAGAFQLTPLKCGTLNHCRSPLSFLLAHWEDGPLGAVRLGWRHGLYCLGCCWALMGVALALGAMNLLWMAGLTVAVGLEKLSRHGRRWSVVLGGTLMGSGIWLLTGRALPF